MTPVGTERRPALVLPDVEDAVVVVAHPDDETLGCGGLLHFLHRAGVPLTVVIASHGEASDPSLGAEGRRTLAVRRIEESRRAIDELAPDATLVRLGLPDGAVADHATELRDALTTICSPSTLLVAHHERDLHPDHEAVGRAATQAAQAHGCTRLAFGIWMWQWPRVDADYDWAAARDFTAGAEDAAAKRVAMRHYRSQTTDRVEDGPVVTAQMLADRLGGIETYFVSTTT